MNLTRDAFDREFCLEHADEAEFMLQQRRQAVSFSTLRPAELLRQDLRLVAHFQGLWLRPEAAWEVITGQLQTRQTAELTALAGIVALTIGKKTRIEWFLAQWERFALAGEAAREIVRWVPGAARQAFLDQENDWPFPVAAGLLAECALSERMLEPWLLKQGQALASEPMATAIAPAVEMLRPSRDFTRQLRQWVEEQAGALSHAALSALLCTPDPQARWVTLGWELADSCTTRWLHARAALRTSPAELSARIKALRTRELVAEALECAAVASHPAQMAFIIEECQRRTHWRHHAHMAFSAVTGIEAQVDAPENQALFQHWTTRSGAEGSGRLLNGAPLSRENLANVIGGGFQYQRSLAVEIARNRNDAQWGAIDTSAPLHRQRQSIQAAIQEQTVVHH